MGYKRVQKLVLMNAHKLVTDRARVMHVHRRMPLQLREHGADRGIETRHLSPDPRRACKSLQQPACADSLEIHSSVIRTNSIFRTLLLWPKRSAFNCLDCIQECCEQPWSAWDCVNR